MNQTRLQSLIEVCLNVGFGFLVSFCCWPLVAWLFDLPYSTMQNLGITSIFTVLSVTRGYLVRRYFNNSLVKASQSISKRLVND